MDWQKQVNRRSEDKNGTERDREHENIKNIDHLSKFLYSYLDIYLVRIPL